MQNKVYSSSTSRSDLMEKRLDQTKSDTLRRVKTL
jgi:hypothetical protein